MQKTVFPFIEVVQENGYFHAAAAFKLISILKGDLLFPAVDPENKKRFDPFDQKIQQQAREMLFGALVSWPACICLELHITSLPDLRQRVSSELLISLFIHATASTETDAKETLLTRYLTLVPLLASHMPEAEFEPVIDASDFTLRKDPFKATHAVSIERRLESMHLSFPLKSSPAGFGTAGLPGQSDRYEIKHRFPWVPSADDWSRLLNTMTGQLDPVQAIIRIRTANKGAGDYINRLESIIAAGEDLISREQPTRVTFSHQTALIRNTTLNTLCSVKNGCFHVGVFLLAPYTIDETLSSSLGQAITAQRCQKEDSGIFQGGFSVVESTVHDALSPDYFSEGDTFSIIEAACAFRLPSPPIYEIYGLPVKRSRTSLAFLNRKQERRGSNILYFLNRHRGIEQEVFSSIEDRMLHTFIIGQTGTGKSTLMESMILQDIRAGRGLAAIDPHGDLVETILGKIPASRADDVIYFNMLDRNFPLGFNLLQWSTIEERDLIVDELYLTLDRIYDMRQTGGPIFEANFRGMLKLLMGDKKRDGFIATLLDFIPCYQNTNFRHWLKQNITDPTTLDFTEELENTTGEASIKALSPYVTSKFSRFINDRSLQRIIGQEQSSLNFDAIMKAGKILLINLGKGRFGNVVSALLTNNLVSRFKHAAMKRGDMKPEERRNFMLYVDECHNLPQDNFMELLAESRKYRMGLVLSTQYAAQLSSLSSNNLLEAILGNVGTTIMFRLGKRDSDALAPILYPHFGPEDIVGLPNWHGYARMQQSNIAAQPFSFVTQKDETPYDERHAQSILNESRKIYGKAAAEIDREIENRRKFVKSVC